eukprot:c43127_g1_i1 orf=203-1702(+)
MRQEREVTMDGNVVRDSSLTTASCVEGARHVGDDIVMEPAEDRMQVDEKISAHQATLSKEIYHFSGQFSSDYLRIYYGRLFPFAEMYKWLSYGNDGKHPGCDSSFFCRREFSFTLEHDIYIRYLSFHDVAEMEAGVREKCPHKIDIGAVYNVDPSKRTAYSNTGSDRIFAPVERELVFDVDMTDYDDIRYCCTGADICLQCWPLMTIAIKVVDTALREDFGFEHILWVYSGRRGVHCWVCDSRARRLTNEQRSSIAEYFRVYKGNENNSRKVALTGAALHPSLSRAYGEVLKQFFEEQVIPNQGLLQHKERFQRILDIVPDDTIVAQVHDRWQENRRSSLGDANYDRWRYFKHLLESNKQKGQAFRRCLEEIIFTYTYPRLDLEVSKHMNHLLKAPFCVHPKTGRVCVPINPMECDSFDPTTVPTITQLLEELNKGDTRSMDCNLDPKEKDWAKTSLLQPVQFFRSTFLNPLIKACKVDLESAYREKLQESASKRSLNW